MNATVRCPHCQAEVPAEGQFCIECGAALPVAATGVTQRVVERETIPGIRCESCDALNPVGARFCVTCGRSLPTMAEAPVPHEPIISTPVAPQPTLPASLPTRRPSTTQWGAISGAVFLLGIAVLAVTGWWWPGIMVLLGLMPLLAIPTTGQLWPSLQGTLWLWGIAVLAVTGWWWPGVLVLVAFSAITGALCRGR